jgi:hypothetical protein
VSQLRTDPNTVCSSAAHKKVQSLAAALITIVGAGVPIGYALWLRYLRSESVRDSLVTNPAWKGLNDPSARASWGGLYEMVRWRAYDACCRTTYTCSRCAQPLTCSTG